jgi:NPCBM/NEW2 domain
MTTMSLTLCCLLLGVSSPEVAVRTLDGETKAGQLSSVSSESIVVKVAENNVTWNTRQLHSLSFQTARAIPAWHVEVYLLDGSMLRGEAFSTQREQATLVVIGGAKFSVPTAQVRQVLLRNSGSTFREQWQSFTADKSSVDRLIVRRMVSDGAAGGATPAISLDVMEGVVVEVTDAFVQFELDGEPLKVKREKIEGILYARKPVELNKTIGFAVDIYGSRWAFQKLHLIESGIAFTSPSGKETQINWDILQMLDFSTSNARYLSFDLKDAENRTDFLAPLSLSKAFAFAPLFDRTPEGSITCGGKVYAHGLWMPARSSLTFQVPEGFSQLTMLVGYDDRSGQTDGARLIVEAEGKNVLDRTFTRVSQPEGVKVPLGNAKRIRILVDYGGDSFVGDTMVLCEAMFTP